MWTCAAQRGCSGCHRSLAPFEYSRSLPPQFFMAYKGALQVSDWELLEGMKACRRLGALVQV